MSIRARLARLEDLRCETPTLKGVICYGTETVEDAWQRTYGSEPMPDTEFPVLNLLGVSVPGEEHLEREES